MEQDPVQPSNKQRRSIAGNPSSYDGDTGSLQLNAEVVQETRYRKAIKRIGTLDALRATQARRGTELAEANERLLHDNEALETQAAVLKDTITKIRDELEESERKRDAQTEVVRRLQAREYKQTKGTAREPHEAISSRFRATFQQCSDWARDYFNIKMVDFDIRKFPEFEKELEKVSWGDSDWGGKQLFKASHLVQAVLGNMICDQIFSCPFAGTPPGFYGQFRDMYEIKYEADRAEAQRWRASSLQTFYSCKSWPLSGQESHSPQFYKEQHVAETVRNIEKVLRPIITTYCPSLSTRELYVQSERLFAIVKCAKTLGENMSKQSSELRVCSKSWFNHCDRLFTSDDSWVKSRLCDEDYDPQDRFRADLILSPGFLKYGNDNAENLNDWSVWTPAIVETHNPARPPPPPLPRLPTAPARTPPAFSPGDSEALPREMQEKEAASLGTTTQQEHNDDEEYEEVQPFMDGTQYWV